MTKTILPSPLSPGIFYGPNVAVLTLVDDFLIIGNTAAIKKEILTQFNTKDLCMLIHYIRLQIVNCDGDQVTLNLQSYLRRAIDETGMVECRPVSPPMEAKGGLLPRGLDKEAAREGINQYQKQLGYYQWADSTTRPDIVRATVKLGEFLANPTAVYKKALKYLDRYIQGTLYYELILGRCPDICANDRVLTVYADTGFVDDSIPNNPFSVLIYDQYGGLIQWKSKKQLTVV